MRTEGGEGGGTRMGLRKGRGTRTPAARRTPVPPEWWEGDVVCVDGTGGGRGEQIETAWGKKGTRSRPRAAQSQAPCRPHRRHAPHTGQGVLGTPGVETHPQGQMSSEAGQELLLPGAEGRTATRSQAGSASRRPRLWSLPQVHGRAHWWG